jgi:hypothetical protein
LAVAAELLRAGCDLSLRNAVGQTPTELAAAGGAPERAEVLRLLQVSSSSQPYPSSDLSTYKETCM